MSVCVGLLEAPMADLNEKKKKDIGATSATHLSMREFCYPSVMTSLVTPL